MILYGHGYIGTAIASALEKAGVRFRHLHHLHLPKSTNFIINAAGFTGSPTIDECESPEGRELCYQGNVYWPLLLESVFHGTPILHIGSGCLYQGGPFAESDRPNFHDSFYSRMKILAEQRLQPFLHKSYLFRIRMPFGKQPHPKNYLTKLRTYERLISEPNSLTCLEELAACVVHFFQTRPAPGIYNVVNPGAITAREIIQMMDLRKTFIPTAQLNVLVPRSNCVLNTQKLNCVFPMRPVRQAVQSCIGEKHEP